MNYFELKKLAGRVDRSESGRKERLLQELLEELPEMDALEGVSNRALIKALRISRRVRA